MLIPTKVDKFFVCEITISVADTDEKPVLHETMALALAIVKSQCPGDWYLFQTLRPTSRSIEFRLRLRIKEDWTQPPTEQEDSNG